MDDHASDIETILARRHDHGGDAWASADGRIYVGSPFSTLSSLGMLHELGVPASHPVVRRGLDLVLDAWRDDGRIRVAPKAPMYPCYTAEAARVLCRFGYADDERIRTTVEYFLAEAHETGGWRCNFTKLGRGPETAGANPGATLFVLDVLRLTGDTVPAPIVDQAIESLLAHWQSRVPCGPCQYGIGSRFLKLEYPFLRYSLFYYVYVLSFFPSARTDPRFRDALGVLETKLDAEGRVVVEAPHQRLKGLEFCRRGAASEVATLRYREVRGNLGP